MNRIRKILFIIVVISQLGALSFMIGKRIHLLNNGKKIILQCEPVDPRSLFSGDYVILNFKISSLPKELFGSIEKIPQSGEAIYVGLGPDRENKYHEAREVSMKPEVLKKKYPVVIRGKIEYTFTRNPGTIPVKYGIEQYFVPQGEGKKIEKNIKNTSVEVSVSSSGEAAVSKIFIDAREIEFR